MREKIIFSVKSTQFYWQFFVCSSFCVGILNEHFFMISGDFPKYYCDNLRIYPYNGKLLFEMDNFLSVVSMWNFLYLWTASFSPLKFYVNLFVSRSHWFAFISTIPGFSMPEHQINIRKNNRKKKCQNLLTDNIFVLGSISLDVDKPYFPFNSHFLFVRKSFSNQKMLYLFFSVRFLFRFVLFYFCRWMAVFHPFSIVFFLVIAQSISISLQVECICCVCARVCAVMIFFSPQRKYTKQIDIVILSIHCAPRIHIFTNILYIFILYAFCIFPPPPFVYYTWSTFFLFLFSTIPFP